MSKSETKDAQKLRSNSVINQLISKFEFKKAKKVISKRKTKLIPILKIIEKIRNESLNDDGIIVLASSRQNATIAIPYLLDSRKDEYRKIAYFLSYYHPDLAPIVYRMERKVDKNFLEYLNVLSRKSPLTLLRLYGLILDDILNLLNSADIEELREEINRMLESNNYFYNYEYEDYSVPKYIVGVIRKSLPEILKVINLFSNIDVIMRIILTVSSSNLNIIKDEILIFIGKFLKLLDFVEKVDASKIYSIMPELFDYLAFLFTKEIINELIEYIPKINKEKMPFDSEGIPIEPDTKLAYWDYDKTDSNCKEKLEGKNIVVFKEAYTISLSPRIYHILNALKRIINSNSKLIYALNYENLERNPIVLEALIELKSVDSKFIKSFVKWLASRKVYVKYHSENIKFYYYKYRWGDCYSHQNIQDVFLAVYAPEFVLAESMSYDDIIESLGIIEGRLATMKPYSSVFVDCLNSYDPQKRTISLREAKEVVLDFVSYVLSFDRYDNKITKFLMAVIKWLGEVPEIIIDYLSHLSDPNNALRFSEFISFRNYSVLDSFIGRGIVAMGRSNIFSNNEVLERVISFLKEASGKDFNLFAQIISNLFDVDLSNVKSLGDFVRAIHPDIDDLLHFCHPDIDLEKKALVHYFECLKSSPENAGDCTFTMLSKTIQKLIENLPPSTFLIDSMTIKKLRDSDSKVIRDLAELFLRQAIKEVSSKKVLINDNTVSLRAIKGTWIWEKYIKKDIVSLVEWENLKKSLTNLGIVIEEISL